MTLSVKHSVVTGAAADPSALVDGPAWDANHVVSFTQSGTGAVARTLDSKLQDVVSVKDFGAVGDGVTDDTTAIQNAINATTGILYFPPGNYQLFSTISTNASNLWLLGAGQGATRLMCKFASGDIICIGDGSANPNNTHISNMSIQSAVTKSSGAAIRFRNGHNLRADNIRIDQNMWVGFQFDGGSGQYGYWLSEFEINQPQSVGILVSGDGTVVQDVFVTRGIIAGSGVGSTTDGIQLVRGSGLYFSQIDITACNHGVTTYPANLTDVVSVWCHQVFADSCRSHGWNLITNGGGLNELNLIGCHGTSCGKTDNGHGIYISTPGRVGAINIVAPHCVNNMGSGIYLNGGTNITITHPECLSNSVQGSGISDGITIAAGVSQFSITGGVCGLGGYYTTNLQNYGINILAGASDNYSITNVLTPSNVTAGINDGGTGTNKTVLSPDGTLLVNKITNLQASAFVKSIGAGGGIGYGIGAGGTVTQATSRTTAVTLNRPAGGITMFSAAGSATPASFVVNNSNVQAVDSVVLSVKSGATNVYNFSVSAVASGQFTVTFYTTGGTATDAPVINFTLIKGAAA